MIVNILLFFVCHLHEIKSIEQLRVALNQELFEKLERPTFGDFCVYENFLSCKTRCGVLPKNIH